MKLDEHIAMIAAIDSLEFKKQDLAEKQSKRFKLRNVLKWIARISLYITGFCIGGIIARAIIGWDLAGTIQAIIGALSGSTFAGTMIATKQNNKKIIQDKTDYDDACKKQDSLLNEMFKEHSAEFAKDGELTPAIGLGMIVAEDGAPVMMFGVGFSTEPTGLIKKRVEGMIEEYSSNTTPLITSGEKADNKDEDSNTDGTTVK